MVRKDLDELDPANGARDVKRAMLDGVGSEGWSADGFTRYA